MVTETAQVVKMNLKQPARRAITLAPKISSSVTQVSVLAEHLFAMETMTVMMAAMRINDTGAWIVHVKQMSSNASLGLGDVTILSVLETGWYVMAILVV